MSDSKEIDSNIDEELGKEEESEQDVDLSKYTNSNYNWYIVNTYSGSEESVKLSLLERIEKENLGEFFGEIYIPKTTVEKILKSGKIEVEKTYRV